MINKGFKNDMKAFFEKFPEIRTFEVEPSALQVEEDLLTGDFFTLGFNHINELGVRTFTQYPLDLTENQASELLEDYRARFSLHHQKERANLLVKLYDDNDLMQFAYEIAKLYNELDYSVVSEVMKEMKARLNLDASKN